MIRESEAGWTFTRTEERLEIRRGGRWRFVNEAADVAAAGFMILLILGIALLPGAVLLNADWPPRWGDRRLRLAVLGLLICLALAALMLWILKTSLRNLRRTIRQIREPVILCKNAPSDRHVRRVVVTFRRVPPSRNVQYSPRTWSILLQTDHHYDLPRVQYVTRAEAAAISRRMAAFLDVPLQEVEIERSNESPPPDMGMPRIMATANLLRCRSPRLPMRRLLAEKGPSILLMWTIFPLMMGIMFLCLFWLGDGPRMFHPLFWNEVVTKSLSKGRLPLLMFILNLFLLPAIFTIVEIFGLASGFVLHRGTRSLYGSYGKRIRLDRIPEVLISAHQARDVAWWTVSLTVQDGEPRIVAHLPNAREADEVAGTFATFLNVPIVREGDGG